MNNNNNAHVTELSNIFNSTGPVKFIINPPPSNGRCQCCGKHTSELRPFGKAGDPLVGDFDGALLVKCFRPDGQYDAEAEKALEAAEEYCTNNECKGPREFLIEKYGKERGEFLYYTGMMCTSFSKSWECQDCIILTNEEYFELQFKSSDQKEEDQTS